MDMGGVHEGMNGEERHGRCRGIKGECLHTKRKIRTRDRRILTAQTGHEQRQCASKKDMDMIGEHGHVQGKWA
jgi:hypothetical protein